MTDPNIDALRAATERMTGTLIEMIGGVIIACRAKDAIDFGTLLGALDTMASNPDATPLERALVERLLGCIEKAS